MNVSFPIGRPGARSVLAAALLASGVAVSRGEVHEKLDQSEISLGGSAYLTVTASGGDPSPAAPQVPGLAFSAIGQTTESQTNNGVQTASTGTIYQVTPERTGSFVIPSLAPGVAPLTLQVDPSAGSSGLPSPAPSGSGGDTPQPAPRGSAFARLLVPKRTLYVGETTPVDIQVGVPSEWSSSLNGLPALLGDAFTFAPLSSQPAQTQLTLGGRSYTVMTWHGALSAIKPGRFAVAVDTPLSVQVPSAPPTSRPPSGESPDDSFFDDPFSDPFFQNFLSTPVQKQLDVRSRPQTIEVRALPRTGQPRDFSGAVGTFRMTSDLSATRAAVGDPLTLRVRISGEGDFDRVNEVVLPAASGWKTYPPTARFHPADPAGYSGEKDFEQAVVPEQAGPGRLPAVSFSYFDPDKRSYETLRTAPLAVRVTGSLGRAAAGETDAADEALPAALPTDGLQPDEAIGGAVATDLRPLYLRPWFLGAQGLMALGLALGGVGLSRRERRANDEAATRRRETSRKITAALQDMDQAAAIRNAGAFFVAARHVLQLRLAEEWGIEPGAITGAELESRLGSRHPEIQRVFAQADEAAYSGQTAATADFQHWAAMVRSHLDGGNPL